MPRVPDPENPIVIVVDGEIGAGKTTLLGHLADGLRARGHTVAEVYEPVGDWKEVGILQEFYQEENPDRRDLVAYDFQTYTFATRVKATRDAVRNAPGFTAAVLERSVLTDRYVFMELQRDLVGPRRMNMYDVWWGMWEEVMPVRIAPGRATMVYLKPTLDNCQARVRTRDREGEVVRDEGADAEGTAAGGVSRAYQERLRRAHEAYLEGLHPGEFPGLPPRPFDLGADVVVVGSPLADGDFSVPGPAAAAIVDIIIDRACRG